MVFVFINLRLLFRDQIVNAYRIVGAVNVYLLLALMGALTLEVIHATTGASIGGNVVLSGKDDDYVHFIYFSLASLTTVGFGDIYAVSTSAQVAGHFPVHSGRPVSGHSHRPPGRTGVQPGEVECDRPRVAMCERAAGGASSTKTATTGPGSGLTHRSPMARQSPEPRCVDRRLRGELPSENAPWQHGDRHVLGHAVDAPEPVEDLELQAMLQQAIRVVLGQARGLLPLQIGRELQYRDALRDDRLRRLLVLLHQCPQRGLRRLLIVCSRRSSSSVVSFDGAISAVFRAWASGARSRLIAALMFSISPVAATSRACSSASLSLSSLRPMCCR